MISPLAVKFFRVVNIPHEWISSIKNNYVDGKEGCQSHKTCNKTCCKFCENSFV
jgi:hypothetical protein